MTKQQYERFKQDIFNHANKDKISPRGQVRNNDRINERANMFECEDSTWKRHKIGYLMDLKHELNEFIKYWLEKHPNIEDTALNELVKDTIEGDYKHVEVLLYSYPQYKYPYEQ